MYIYIIYKYIYIYIYIYIYTLLIYFSHAYSIHFGFHKITKNPLIDLVRVLLSNKKLFIFLNEAFSAWNPKLWCFTQLYL